MAPTVTVSAPVFTPSGNDLVVTFNVKTDGVNFTQLTTAARQYQFNGTLRNTLNSIDATVPGDVLTPATLSGGTSGNYTITITNGFSVYGATPSRYLFRLETPLGSAEPRAMVMGDYPSSPDQTLVSQAGCTGCHSTMGNGFHYGYPTNGLNCTVCHDATNTTYPRLVNIGHGIHNSEQMPAGSYELKTTTGSTAGTFAVSYPTYMTNCSVCHTAASGALAKVNQMPVTGGGCLSCHGDMTSWEEDFTASGAIFHLGYDGTEDCTVCHNAAPDAAAPGLVKVTDFHNGLETENVGIIEDGEDTSITEGAKFTWQITSVADSATEANRVITWTATYNAAPVDPCNSDVAAGPVFFNFPAGAVIDGQPGMLTTYMQGNDYILGQATNEPGQPVNVNLTTANTTCAGNVATTTIARGTVPAGATVGIVALQGKPALPLPSNVDTAVYPYTYMYVRVPTPTYQFVVGTGAASTRRASHDRRHDKCTTCHVGSLYQHGNTRVDNALMCTVCHNSASSEQSVRYGMGVDASEAYDGLIGQTFELKTMLHRIHTAGEQTEAAPFVIYRTRGIFAWAPEGAVIPNWPTASTPECQPGKYQVYGALPYSAGPPAVNPNSCQTFTQWAPTYPRLFNDCYACHMTGSVNDTPEQSEAVATTLNAGGTVWQNQLDDTLQGASAAACTSCHTSTDAKGHAYQNGWVPQVFPEGRQTIIDTN